MAKYELQCSELKGPYIIKPNRITTAFDATTTPSGNVSDLHIDYTGLTTLITAIVGSKLILVYPPTETNLRVFDRFHGMANPIWLWSAMAGSSEMEGLQVEILRPGKGIRLGSAAIHCVISAEWASVGGITVAKYSALDEAVKGMRWEYEVMKQREKSQIKEIRDSAKVIRGELAEVYGLWLKLAHKEGGRTEKMIHRKLLFLDEFQRRTRKNKRKTGETFPEQSKRYKRDFQKPLQETPLSRSPVVQTSTLDVIHRESSQPTSFIDTMVTDRATTPPAQS